MGQEIPLPGNHISHTALMMNLVLRQDHVTHAGLDFTTINKGRKAWKELEPRVWI